MTDCPFYAGSTIDDPRLFIGREDALKTLCNGLTGVQACSINVVGMHRTGKSSLLVHFCNTYRQRVPEPDRFIVVYLSLQQAACHRSPESFFSTVAKVLKQQTPVHSYSLEKLLKTRQWDQAKFKELLGAFKKASILPVLCLDNFEELLERKEDFPNGFYDNFRHFVDQNDLMVVMASCVSLEIYSKQKKITSDFFNLFQFIRLNGGLTPEEASKLVGIKNFQGDGLTPELQEKALQWGKQEPFLLQLAGRLLWQVKIGQKSLQWAEQEFKVQTQPFSFQPKSKFLAVLYRGISQIGTGVLWFNANRKDMQTFWVGLIFLVVVVVIALLFACGVIDFAQLKSLFQKTSK